MLGKPGEYHLKDKRRTKKSMSGEQVCLSCGACCTMFRVSFYWGEADPVFGGSVPIELTEKLSETRRVMKGTNQPRPRCIALVGHAGKQVACTIYENRPTPCRAFSVSWENGQHNPDCDQARAMVGLPPVTPEMLRAVEEIGPVPSEEPLQGICGRVIVPTS